MSFNAKDPRVTEEEIIKFYTDILRGGDERFKTADAFKAAEFFVRYFGILEGNGSEGGVVITDDIHPRNADDSAENGGEKDG